MGTGSTGFQENDSATSVVKQVGEQALTNLAAHSSWSTSCKVVNSIAVRTKAKRKAFPLNREGLTSAATDLHDILSIHHILQCGELLGACRMDTNKIVEI